MCRSGEVVVVLKMILFWEFWVTHFCFGERDDTQESKSWKKEKEKKKKREKKEVLFLINWKDGVFLSFKFVPLKQYTHASHMLHISVKLNYKTNVGVQNVTRLIV